MKDKKADKKQDFRDRKTSKFLLAIFNEVAQRFSVKLLLNARKQVRELLGQIKRGILAGFFVIFGVFFLLIGLAVYIESSWGFIPGGGYLTVGGISILLAFLVIFSKK